MMIARDKITEAAIIGLLGWMGLTSHNTSVSIAELDQKMTGFEQLSEVLAESYTHRLATVEDRAKNLASRIRDLEKAVPRDSSS